MYKEADTILSQRRYIGNVTNMLERNAARVAVQVRELYHLDKGTEIPAKIYMYCKARIKGSTRVDAYKYAQVADISSFLT